MPRFDLSCDGVIGLGVRERSDDLDVDRRGESEIENLADDIGGLEEEGQVRVVVIEAGAQLADVVRRWTRDRPARSETRISPSNGPMVAVSLMAMFRPE